MTAKTGTYLRKTSIWLLCLLSLAACKPAEEVEPLARERWQKIVELHPVDRTKVVQMMIQAENRLPSQTDRAALILSCQQFETEAYIVWRQYLGAYDLDVTWRAGSSEEITDRWTLSTDSEAIFSPDAVGFIEQVMLYDELLVKSTPFGSEPLTLVFNTTGLAREIDELRQACKW